MVVNAGHGRPGDRTHGDRPMKISDAQVLVAMLIAAFPRSDWPESTQRLYRETLAECGVLDGRRAIERLIATSDFPPTIAEIRRTVAEARLNLPSEMEAWEMAVAHAEARRVGAPRAYCVACAGTGTRVGGDLCPDCDGTGELDELDLERMPPVPDPIPRAVKTVGGWRVLRETDRPQLVRRDFIESYRRVRQEMIVRVSLESLGANGDHPIVEDVVRREIEAAS